MKCRIIQTCKLYHGEVYGMWRNLITGKKWTGWRPVIRNYTTRRSVVQELKEYKEEHYPDEFEL